MTRDFRCWHKCEVPTALSNVRFSNRPFEVKRFQTIRHCSVDVARGLVRLFGIGTRALPSWDSKTRCDLLPNLPSLNRGHLRGAGHLPCGHPPRCCRQSYVYALTE